MRRMRSAQGRDKALVGRAADHRPAGRLALVRDEDGRRVHGHGDRYFDGGSVRLCSWLHGGMTGTTRCGTQCGTVVFG